MFRSETKRRALHVVAALCCPTLLLTACGGIGQSGESSPDLNNPPQFTTPTRFVIPENTRSIATLTATDADGDVVTYEIIGGDDEQRFSLDADNGTFAFTNNPNYEAPSDTDRDNHYIVKVQATDQLNTHQQTITVVVSNIDELLSFTSPNRILVEELNTAVVVLKTNDPENTRTTFSIVGGNDQALFNLDPNTGELTFIDAPDFDAPTDSDGNNQYAISVSAFDGVNSITQNINIVIHREIEVDLFSDIKTLTFDWADYPNASHYKVFVNPDGASGFAQLGEDLSNHELSLDVPVHLTDWLNAGYRVEAHDGGGIIGFSGPLAISDHMLDTIGYLKATNSQADDGFGAAIALSADGTTLAVGAPGEDSGTPIINGDQTDNSAGQSGAVYVFVRNDDGWQQQAYIKPLDGESDAEFGASVALDGDGNTLVVGAPGKPVVITIPVEGGIDETVIQPDTGNAYVFTRNDGAWGQVDSLIGDNTTEGDRFGSAVSIDDAGELLMVGAPATAGGGAVYAFTRDVDTWTQETFIMASNASPADRFGASVVLNGSGDILAVGAPKEDGDGAGINPPTNDNGLDTGAIYLFSRSFTSWLQQVYAKSANSGPGQHFGVSVALNQTADVLAVGASGESGMGSGVDGDPTQDAAFDQSGAVYILSFEDFAWGQRAYVKAPAPTAGDQFGSHVSLNATGDLLAVGASFEDSIAIGLDGDVFDDSLPESGAVYLYHLPPAENELDIPQWTYQRYIKAPNSGQDDRFGLPAVLSDDGNTLAISAPGEASAATSISGDRNDDSAAGAGAIYLY